MTVRPFIILSFLATPALAQEPLVTDRPDFTESASVVERGRLQLESGYTFTRATGVRRHDLGEFLLRVGLGARLELRLAPNSYTWLESPELDTDGLEDAFLGSKWLFAAGDRGSAALLAGTSLPTGADDLGADGWQPEVVLALAGGPLGINLGWGWEDAGESRRHTGLASVAAGLPLTESTGLFLETYTLVAEGSGGAEAYADAGLTRLLSADFQLDARVGVGLTDDSEDWFAGLGFARRW